MKAEDVKQHLALERSRHPNRLIGKGFPYMKRNMLPLLVGDDEEGLALGYYPEHRDVEEEGASENMAEDDIQVITRRLWMYLLQRANIDSEKKWSQVDVQDIDRIVKEVTSCELSTNGKHHVDLMSN